MKKSFKEFKVLFEESTDSAIEELVQYAMKNGFIENLSAMVESGHFFFRGSENMASSINDSGKLYVLYPKRSEQRESIYSSSKILTNLWHSYDHLPSRKVARFATTSHDNASDFGGVSIVVPKDGAKMTLSKTDFNTGYSKFLEKFLGVHKDRGFELGEVSQIMRDTVDDVVNIVEDLGKAAQADALHTLKFQVAANTATPAKVKKFLAALDDALEIIDFSTDRVDKYFARRDGRYHENTKTTIKLLRDNRPLYDHFKNFFDAIHGEMTTTESMKDIHSALMKIPEDGDFGATEIWWEADTLALDAMLHRPLYVKKLRFAIDAARFMHHMNK